MIFLWRCVCVCVHVNVCVSAVRSARSFARSAWARHPGSPQEVRKDMENIGYQVSVSHPSVRYRQEQIHARPSACGRLPVCGPMGCAGGLLLRAQEGAFSGAHGDPRGTGGQVLELGNPSCMGKGSAGWWARSIWTICRMSTGCRGVAPIRSPRMGSNRCAAQGSWARRGPGAHATPYRGLKSIGIGPLGFVTGDANCLSTHVQTHPGRGGWTQEGYPGVLEAPACGPASRSARRWQRSPGVG